MSPTPPIESWSYADGIALTTSYPVPIEQVRMTPREARELAADLNATADYAEQTSGEVSP